MQDLAAANVADGSIASSERRRHVGFTPDSGRMTATQRTDALGQKRKSPKLREAASIASVASGTSYARLLPPGILRDRMIKDPLVQKCCDTVEPLVLL